MAYGLIDPVLDKLIVYFNSLPLHYFEAISNQYSLFISYQYSCQNPFIKFPLLTEL